MLSFSSYISLVVMALLVSCTAQPQPAVAEETVPLRIVTLNAEILTAPGSRGGSIHKYRFQHARGKHLERVAAVIETLDPDVLNLVEVTNKETVDKLVEVLHEKGLDDYRGYHVQNNDTFTELDVALISRYQPDIVDGAAIRTFYSPEGDPTWRQAFRFTGRNGSPREGFTSLSRNALYCITIAGHRLGFLGLHLKSNPQDDYSNAKRTAQAEIARRVLRSEVVERGYVPIVLGDINDYDPDVPDRDETRDASTNVLRNIKDFDTTREGDELVNVAERIARQRDRYTSHWDWNENGAHDGDDVYTMIDHILLARQLMPYVERVFISHAVSLDTSDHYPVIVDLKLPDLQGQNAVAQRPPQP